MVLKSEVYQIIKWVEVGGGERGEEKKVRVLTLEKKKTN